MELNQKLQELRKQKGITQEELAASLYVSRAAISKWESGRGHPSLDSLKAIARFYSITVDDLLSPNEILTIAEVDAKQKTNHFRDLIYGLLDISMVMLLFLPLFAKNANGNIQSVSLIALNGIRLYLKVAFLGIVFLITAMGVLTLALQNCQASFWHKYKAVISLSLGVVSVLLFIISLQPYPATLALALWAIKVFVQLKSQ